MTDLKPNPNIPCKLLRETEDYLFLEKPVGLHSVAQKSSDEESVANWLLSVNPSLKNVSTPLESGLLHRLDNETSGAMVAAKNKKAYDYLRDLFQKNQVEKEYVCLIDRSGLKSGLYFAYAGSRYRSSKKVSISEKPKKRFQMIQTEILNVDGNFATIRLITGYRHQIRAHLSYLGYPLCGDELYGGSSAPRLMLHSAMLSFKNPQGKIEIVKSIQPF